MLLGCANYLETISLQKLMSCLCISRDYFLRVSFKSVKWLAIYFANTHLNTGTSVERAAGVLCVDGHQAEVVHHDLWADADLLVSFLNQLLSQKVVSQIWCGSS